MKKQLQEFSSKVENNSPDLEFQINLENFGAKPAKVIFTLKRSSSLLMFFVDKIGLCIKDTIVFMFYINSCLEVIIIS